MSTRKSSVNRVFKKEAERLFHARRRVLRDEQSLSELKSDYLEFCREYFRLLKRTISMTRMADAMQRELMQTNKQLQYAHRKMGTQLEIARQIQEHLYPLETRKLPGLDVHSRYIALDRVGGDFLDYTMPGEGLAGILLGDAAGHGVPASLVGSMARMALSGLSEWNTHPARLLGGLNDSLLHKIDRHYVTACYVIFNAANRSMRYSLGAHPPPFLLRPGKPAEQLPGEGTVIGMFADAEYDEWEQQLQPGDRILLITDGILECFSPEMNALTLDQLTDLLTGLANRQPEDLLNGLLDELRLFIGSSTFQDDVTVILLVVS